jgi:hypothetical protein
MLCGYCGNEFEPRKQGRRQIFCPGGKCRRAAETKDRRHGRAIRERHQKGRPVDFEEARQDPEFQRKVAEVLAWAEAQHPATPEAWGFNADREKAASCGMKIASGKETDNVLADLAVH